MSALVSPPVLTGSLLALGGVLVAVSGRRELRQRWFTWVGVAGVLFAASHLPHGMLALAAALAVVAGAELARLTARPGLPVAAAWTGTVAAFAAGVLLPRPALVVAVAVAAALFPLLVGRRGTAATVLLPGTLVGLPLAALATLPVSLTLPAMMAVSIGDVGAWVGGRTLGRRAPFSARLSAWSPNKNWAGALASVLVGGVVLAALGRYELIPLVPVAGILGDLRESRVKRLAGVKDAGRWLPGFGGLLDRIDSVLGALVGVCVTAVVAPVAGWLPLALAALVAVVAVPGAACRRLLWRGVFATSGGLTVTGELPAGGCVVVAPHASHADSAALIAAIDAGHAPAFAAAADYWFATRLRAAACRTLIGGFPVRRTGGGMADLRAAAAPALRDGRAVVVYPSGSRDAAAGTWHAGAFRLAAECEVPVVVAVIEGTDRLLPKSGGLTRTHVTVRIGGPIDAADPVHAAATAAHHAA